MNKPESNGEILTDKEAKRFWAKVLTIGGSAECWPWIAGGSHGYGEFRLRGMKISAHRLAYALHHRVLLESLKSLIIRHACDNPGCVNGSHLESGSVADNVRDCVERGRHAEVRKEKCPRGHPYNAMRLRSNGRAGRRCSICDAMIGRAWVSANRKHVSERQRAWWVVNGNRINKS